MTRFGPRVEPITSPTVGGYATSYATDAGYGFLLAIYSNFICCFNLAQSIYAERRKFVLGTNKAKLLHFQLELFPSVSAHAHIYMDASMEGEVIGRLIYCLPIMRQNSLNGLYSLMYDNKWVTYFALY